MSFRGPKAHGDRPHKAEVCASQLLRRASSADPRFRGPRFVLRRRKAADRKNGGLRYPRVFCFLPTAYLPTAYCPLPSFSFSFSCWIIWAMSERTCFRRHGLASQRTWTITSLLTG